eukprot:COSAG01_NODE_333_length_18717_cov_40.372072_3_plen_221_part_00
MCQDGSNCVRVAQRVWCVCLLCLRMADSFQEKLQGSTLYVLTIASVTIMPIQLMTGIFGMNFSYGDGTCPDDPDGGACPAMWELHWKHGYRAFWALGLALTGLVILAMHKKGILKSRSIHWSTTLDEGLLAQEAEVEQAKDRFRSASVRSPNGSKPTELITDILPGLGRVGTKGDKGSSSSAWAGGSGSGPGDAYSADSPSSSSTGAAAGVGGRGHLIHP